MNRHICKAKSVYDGEWIYGYYVNVPWEYETSGVYLIIEPDAEYKGAGKFTWNCVSRVDPDTICRCTGKEDKNGNLIFEHDIVVVKSDVPMTVCWDDDYASFDAVYELDGVGLCCNSLCSSERLEIVGNEFDNTELMRY